eukprot:TRINITY_DN534_c0_g1_i2.p2 TRINITY_DN534_c0_g1~~TRINITY_DN534_c0_g1_i2.p2  ORF type:complete len:133 (-),score=47.92 TRINITY_DN534_c0_g1_i2:55-453(-)
MSAVKKEVGKDSAGEELAVIHFKYRSPSRMVYNRDFVVLATTERTLTSAVIACKSIAYEKVPEESGFVRGELHASAFLIESVDGGVKVNYVVQADPKGWIPTFVVNVVAKDEPLVLATMRDYVVAKHAQHPP